MAWTTNLNWWSPDFFHQQYCEFPWASRALRLQVRRMLQSLQLVVLRWCNDPKENHRIGISKRDHYMGPLLGKWKKQQMYGKFWWISSKHSSLFGLVIYWPLKPSLNRAQSDGSSFRLIGDLDGSVSLWGKARQIVRSVAFTMWQKDRADGDERVFGSDMV